MDGFDPDTVKRRILARRAELRDMIAQADNSVVRFLFAPAATAASAFLTRLALFFARLSRRR